MNKKTPAAAAALSLLWTSLAPSARAVIVQARAPVPAALPAAGPAAVPSMPGGVPGLGALSTTLRSPALSGVTPPAAAMPPGAAAAAPLAAAASPAAARAPLPPGAEPGAVPAAPRPLARPGFAPLPASPAAAHETGSAALAAALDAPGLDRLFDKASPRRGARTEVVVTQAGAFVYVRFHSRRELERAVDGGRLPRTVTGPDGLTYFVHPELTREATRQEQRRFSRQVRSRLGKIAGVRRVQVHQSPWAASISVHFRDRESMRRAMDGGSLPRSVSSPDGYEHQVFAGLTPEAARREQRGFKRELRERIEESVGGKPQVRLAPVKDLPRGGGIER